MAIVSELFINEKEELFFHCRILKDKIECRNPGGEVLPYKRQMGMCRWMGPHFHDWIDYYGVTFFVELLE